MLYDLFCIWTKAIIVAALSHTLTNACVQIVKKKSFDDTTTVMLNVIQKKYKLFVVFVSNGLNLSYL